MVLEYVRLYIIMLVKNYKALKFRASNSSYFQISTSLFQMLSYRKHRILKFQNWISTRHDK